MKIYSKYIFLVILLLNFSTSYAETVKIVYIDLDKIFKVSIVGKSMNDQINQIKDENNNIAKKKEQEIKEEDKNINNQKNILSEEEIKKKIQSLRSKIQNYQVDVKKLNENLNNKRRIATEKILSELRPILAEYSKENLISLVLKKKDVIIGKNDLDITNDIIDLLNKKMKEINIKNF